MAKKQKIVILRRDEEEIMDVDEVKGPLDKASADAEASPVKEQVQPKDVKVFLRTFG